MDDVNSVWPGRDPRLPTAKRNLDNTMRPTASLPAPTGPCLLLLDDRSETWGAAHVIQNRWNRPVYFVPYWSQARPNPGSQQKEIARYWNTLQLSHLLRVGGQPVRVLPNQLYMPPHASRRQYLRLLDSVALQFNIQTVVVTWAPDPSDWQVLDSRVHHIILRTTPPLFFDISLNQHGFDCDLRHLLLLRFCPDTECQGAGSACNYCNHLRRLLLHPWMQGILASGANVCHPTRPRHKLSAWGDLESVAPQLKPKVAGRESVRVKSVY